MDVVRAQDRPKVKFHRNHEQDIMIKTLRDELNIMRWNVAEAKNEAKFNQQCVNDYFEHMLKMDERQHEMVEMIASLESSLQSERELNGSLHDDLKIEKGLLEEESQSKASIIKKLKDEKANHIHNVKAAVAELDKVKVDRDELSEALTDRLRRFEEQVVHVKQLRNEANLYFKQKGQLEALCRDFIPFLEKSNMSADTKKKFKYAVENIGKEGLE